ncbi:hypothetical protein BVG01_23560 [Bacillus anthracis]|nr:hypothetical protein BVG01_23560 [Bacillus anthracis]
MQASFILYKTNANADKEKTLSAFFYFGEKCNTVIYMDKTSISGKTTNESMILPKRGERK